MTRLDLLRGEDDIGYRKGVLMLLNLLITFVGIELIGLGVYDISKGNIPRASFTFPGLLLGLGVLIFLFSFHGHISTYLESKDQLKLYFIILSIFTIIQAIFLGVLIYGRSYVGDVVNRFWIYAYDDSPYLLRNIEEEYGCCGLHTTIDHAFPKKEEAACIKSDYFGYQVPCYGFLKNSVATEMTTLIVWISIALAIHFVTTLFTFYTYKNISVPDEREPLLRS
ncbi:hypothetical protein K502DRAFT_352353 [Neoconidiobolus thromboides FSU 785]|nr:hypothetical protein K502DRAFT_352353 [Neoconidiobolus thromboides FSU 785]